MYLNYTRPAPGHSSLARSSRSQDVRWRAARPRPPAAPCSSSASCCCLPSYSCFLRRWLHPTGTESAPASAAAWRSAATEAIPWISAPAAACPPASSSPASRARRSPSAGPTPSPGASSAPACAAAW
uniref:Uncharacterized protein n=1 Tax=Setaria italica TaxID=4555 RepID=K3Y424_SETIT